MTTEEKIDEVLKIVRGHEERFSSIEARMEERFSRLEARDDELLQLIREEAKKSEARDHQLFLLIQEQGERHDRRFVQIDGRIGQLETRLDAKIDKVFDSLSQDIHAFAGDLHHLQNRVSRLEKKRSPGL